MGKYQKINGMYEFLTSEIEQTAVLYAMLFKMVRTRNGRKGMNVREEL